MKKILALLVVILGLTGCEDKVTEDSKSETLGVINVYIGDGGVYDNIKVIGFNFSGHKYIRFHYGDRTSTVHDPECMKRDLAKMTINIDTVLIRPTEVDTTVVSTEIGW